MKKPKTYSVKEVFDSAKLGFEFDFYCSKEQLFIVEDLKKITGLPVVLTENDNIKPSFSTAILCKLYSGKRPRFKFKIYEQEYNIIPTFINTILFWINENASLDNTTLLKTYVNYDKTLQTLSNISNMDIAKLILKINEDYIYQRFPEMKGNPFAISVKKLVPHNFSSSASHVVNIRNNFRLPVNTFYGIDLSDQVRGEISFNYIGGEKYSEKAKEIIQILEYYVITTYQVLNEYEYPNSLVNEFNKLTEEYRKFRKCYYNYNRFKEIYKDFSIFIDLNNKNEIIESQWYRIRDVVASLILESNINSCKFNWDTEFGTFQIKDAKADNVILNNMHIVDSEISGIVEGCHFWKCKVEKARVVKSTLVNNNNIESSYLQNVRADKENKISKSFIINEGEIINCSINSSIIKNAGIGEKAKLDESCLVVNPKESFIKSNTGIIIDEVRDYKWIKSLRRSDYKDNGFANEYKEI